MTKKQRDIQAEREYAKHSAKVKGVRALREFGWPGVTADNICSDRVYSIAFRSSLEEAIELGKERRSDVSVLEELVAEIDNRPASRD